MKSKEEKNKKMTDMAIEAGVSELHELDPSFLYVSGHLTVAAWDDETNKGRFARWTSLGDVKISDDVCVLDLPQSVFLCEEVACKTGLDGYVALICLYMSDGVEKTAVVPISQSAIAEIIKSI